MTTKAELESANQELVAQYEALKKNIVEKARNLADEHGWCEVVDDALAELGLLDRRKATLEITVQVPIVIKDDAVVNAEQLAREIRWQVMNYTSARPYVSDTDWDEDEVELADEEVEYKVELVER